MQKYSGDLDRRTRPYNSIPKRQRNTVYCSHGIYKGEGEDVEGNLWRWLYNYVTGPKFVFDTGKEMKLMGKRNVMFVEK